LTSDGTGTGAFSSTLMGLSPSTLYYVRAYATNIIGTAYGNEENFTTLAMPPPIVSLGQVTGCISSVVSVPITVQNFTNVSAVSLDLNYNAAALTYTGFDNSALTGTLIVNNPSVGGVPQGRVLVSWFSLTPANIGSGLLMNLTFTVNGSSTVNWNLAVPGQCELADGDGEVIEDVVFTNGSVTSGGALITSQPASSLPLALGASGSLSVVASGATGYQWQVRVGGGAWTNLSNGTDYSGVTTSTLGIVASAAMNGNEYRVLVSGGSCPSVTSSVSMLVVYSSTIVSLGHVTGCSGSVPITVQNFTNVTAVSLELNYDASALTYTGFNNSALTGNLVVNNPSVGGVPQGRVLVLWSSLTPANIGSGLLMNLTFTVNGSSTVNWNLAVPGQCELADVAGDVIENVVFTNGSVTCGSASLPTVTTTSAIAITSTGATTGGNVTSDGGASVTARGVAYGTSQSPTTANSTTSNGTGTGVFNSTLTGLTASTLYYVRAYATNSVGTAYGNEVSFMTTSPLTIGTNYAGGIVFYVDPTGQHGLVCAPSDQGTFPWGCYGTDISGTSTAFGTGMANTLAIVNGCNQRPIAASVCNDLVLNGYDDWYLPSMDELSLMYQNLRTQNLGNFSNIWYWSSSQGVSGVAWYVYFGSGSVNLNYKSNDGQVRAVRAF
jgi:hypothetical protein